jgi:hypothetical protein
MSTCPDTRQTSLTERVGAAAQAAPGGPSLRPVERKRVLAETPEGKVLLDLWQRGRRELTLIDIQRATRDWPLGLVERYAPLIPAWLLAALRRTKTPRKSATVGLSGAYDWSNSQIKDHVLIRKVLERHQFDDMVRLCAYYGVTRVKRVYRSTEPGPLARASIDRMLRNIERGFRMAKERE